MPTPPASPSASGPSAEPAAPDRAAVLERKTRALIAAASAGDFEVARHDFGPEMLQALPTATFAGTWKTITSRAGALSSVDRVVMRTRGGTFLDEATCTFSGAQLVVRVSYDDGGHVIGLHMVPAAASPTSSWSPPPYIDPAKFGERPITVGTAHILPGTLSLPKSPAHPPVVILVHGSGPSDADETVGGVKVFRDLAGGLASRGVAVLRYEKRSAVDPDGIVTQRQEVEDAVLDAIALVKHTPELDGRRVFLLGHSQGAMLAPRIAKEHPGLAGLVLLAGPTASLQDAVIEQLTYLSSLSRDNAAALAPQLAAAREVKKQVESPDLKPDDSVSLLGARLRGAYFLDVRGYDPAAVAATLDLPLLVLQGERDYQVTMKSFAQWQRALGGRKGASLRSYPRDNHLFVRGEGPPSPAEYASPAHVDAAVVDDVASWVLAQPPR